MAINTHGGGANTNYHGLRFEQETDLIDALENIGCVIEGANVYMGYHHIGVIGAKYNFIRNILEPNNIDIGILSKKLLPDEAFFNFDTNTVYILEKKFQHSSGSVDEKLQTCDFKKRQYKRLFESHDIDVEYCYICNDWFKQDAYRDVIDYIHLVGCHIFFDEIPVEFLGLLRDSEE